MKGNVDGQEVLLGNEALLNQFNIQVPEDLKQKVVENQDQARTISYLTKDGKVLGFLSFSDKIKESPKKAIVYLQNQNTNILQLFENLNYIFLLLGQLVHKTYPSFHLSSNSYLYEKLI